MAAARTAVSETYAWFTHGSAVANFEKIKEHGLRLSNPYMRGQLTELVEDPAQQPSGSVICLQPFPKTRPLPVPGPACKLALNRDALPERIGIDYSFGGALDLLQKLHRQHPDWPVDRIFMEVVKCHEALVSYDPIPAGALRVCPAANPNLPPQEWPALSTIKNQADVYVVENDLQEMSWV